MSRGRYWDAPVLRSVLPVVKTSRHVETRPEGIGQVADWMAYEEFVFPTGGIGGPFPLGDDPDRVIDITMFIATQNFAFSDFDTGVKFEADRHGTTYSDTEAMFARVMDALDAGIPLLDGAYLADISRRDLEDIFHGNIEMPMLDERVKILNDVGATLTESYDGKFHRFVRDCQPAMYADGDGLMERLIGEFPRFDDMSVHRGHQVRLYKLAQLALWALHIALRGHGWQVSDIEQMTAFADYIVPVALRRMGILGYTDELEADINAGVPLLRDSEEEIEIRAHTLYATALLTDAINELRPPSLQLIIPQVDYRLWKAFHATFWPHHLTQTIMY